MLMAIKKVLDKNSPIETCSRPGTELDVMSSSPYLPNLVLIDSAAGLNKSTVALSSAATQQTEFSSESNVAVFDQTSSSALTENTSFVDPLATWLTPVNPESDLAKRMKMVPTFIKNMLNCVNYYALMFTTADKSSYTKFGKCTRRWLLEKVKEWMGNENTEQRAFLLRGGAGLGKSVMAGVLWMLNNRVYL